MTANHIDEKNSIPLITFWFGFLIYIFSYLVAQSGIASYALCNMFQVLGLLVFISSAVFLFSIRIDNNYLALIYSLLLMWTALVVVRGIRFDYNSLKEMLFHPITGLFPYLVPLVLLIPRNEKSFKKIFEIITILGIVYLGFCAIFIKDLLIKHNDVRSQGMIEALTQHLALPSGFILFTAIYHSGKRKFFALFIMVLAFLLVVLRARRGLMFMTFIILFTSYLFYQYINKTKVIYVVISAFFITMISAAAIKIYDSHRKDTFSLITERVGQQTRSYVEQKFYDGLETKDWVIGKGINGEYFCPGVREGLGRLSIYRRVIETGYLQIILNGGIISLVLLMLIMIPAIIKGLFFSKNLLSKGAAAWIILFLLYSYPGIPSIFSFNYILVWISIGICYSEGIRNLPESDMIRLLRNKSLPASEVDDIQTSET